MSDMDLENTSSSGAMERFLIWFLIPFVFTAVLLGVLLTIFDYDVMNNVLRAANRVPIVKSIVPDPKPSASDSTTTSGTTQQNSAESQTQEEIVQSLNAKLSTKEQELTQSNNLIQQRDQLIKELQLKNSSLEEQMKSKTQSDEDYTNQIQQLASMYAKMTPSKAAPIMENLTTSELVLVLSMMKTDERVKILEKMDAKKAADATILLKDQTSTKDREIAALQDRVKELSKPSAASTQKISKDDLGATFSSMTPKSAATVLLEMQNANPEKVISILSSMDSAGRSRVLTALSELSKETAALISARLVQ
ncbi:MotE family protein [Paenibacillus sp. NPDC056579]|uniref:MotE family protein n=1 Tax=Paenibacillus sp. NPDC056579 TaxID=3345871 RepID=UPI0036CA07F0